MQTLTRKQVLALLKRGESETVEFKKTFDREAIETLSAFANTHGGRVFIGVSDTGRVLGGISARKPSRTGSTRLS